IYFGTVVSVLTLKLRLKHIQTLVIARMTCFVLMVVSCVQKWLVKVVT
ncbi:bacterial NAD-glutamate dehydrogenase family protein, partial [Vibrio parahaemolyticus V-223/04]